MDFLIKSGEHYSNRLLYKTFNILNTRRFLSYIVSFSKECQYTLNKEDQADINKLFGFSYGWNHHRNSARFGWCWNNNQLEIYSYVYEAGIRKSNFITVVDLDKEYKMSIQDEDDQWVFIINNDWGSPIQTFVEKNCKFTCGLKLWPFFGGNNPAPHDMTITMLYWD